MKISISAQVYLFLRLRPHSVFICSLLFIPISVITGSNSFCVLEVPTEGTGIGKACHRGNLIHGQAGCPQKLLGVADSNMVNVGQKPFIGNGFKQLGNIIGGQSHSLRNGTHIQVYICIVIVHIILNFPDNLSVFTLGIGP